MTKSERERLKKECEMGLHAASYEVLLKAELRKERRREKHAKTLAAKVHRDLLVENAELKKERDMYRTACKAYLSEIDDLMDKLRKLALLTTATFPKPEEKSPQTF